MMFSKQVKIFLVVFLLIVTVILAIDFQMKEEKLQKNIYVLNSFIENLMKINQKIDDNVLKSTLYNLHDNSKIDQGFEDCKDLFKVIKKSVIYTTPNYPETKQTIEFCFSHSEMRKKHIGMIQKNNLQVQDSIVFIASNLQRFDYLSREQRKKLYRFVGKIYTAKNSMEITGEDLLLSDLDFINEDLVRRDSDRGFVQLYRKHIDLLNKNLPKLIKNTKNLLDDSYRQEQFESMKKSLLKEHGLLQQELDKQFYLIVFLALITLPLVIYFIMKLETEKRRVIRLQDEYIRSVMFDKVTGIHNRNAYMEKLREYESVSVILFDIVEFSSINSLYGIEVGDFVLKSVAKKMEEYIEKDSSMSLFKVGTDQFAVMMKKILDREAYQIAKEIIDTIENNGFKSDLLKQPLNVQLQAGISSKEPYLINSATVLKSIADDQHLKIGVYDSSYDNTIEIQQNILMVQKIKKCLLNDNVTLLFQPLVDLKTKQIVKYEGLVRLKDDDEFISPYYFLALSKKAKLYTQITHEVIRKALEIIKVDNIDLSINLSIEDIYHNETQKFIMDMLADDLEISKRLTFELLESDEIKDFKKVQKFIKNVKKYGCKIAIDDFGSGYSNYAYLIELDADILKIDGSLIKNLDKSENNQLVVKSIVEFAKLANIKTVAEFVENEEIENIIQHLGIDYGQGYYYSAPKLI